MNRDESNKSLNYFAPELLQNQQYNWKVDMWSLGILLYQLLHHQFPFQSGNIQTDINKTASRAIEFGTISNESKDLIISLLCLDPNQRPDLSAIFSHQWMQSYAAKLKINLNEYIYNSQPRTPEKDVLGSLDYKGQSELLSPTQVSPSTKINPFLSPSSSQKILVPPEPKTYENKVDQSSPIAMKLEKPKSQSPGQKSEVVKSSSSPVIVPYSTVNTVSLENYQNTSSTANRSMPDNQKASYSTSPDKPYANNNSDIESLLKQYKGDNPQEMRLLDKLDNYYTTGEMKTPVSTSPLQISNPNKLSAPIEPPINKNKFSREIETEYNNKLSEEKDDDAKGSSMRGQFSFGEKNKSVESHKIQQGSMALKGGKREDEQKQLNQPTKSTPKKYQENGYSPLVNDEENPDYEVQSQDLMRKYKSQMNNIYHRSGSNAHGK